MVFVSNRSRRCCSFCLFFCLVHGGHRHVMEIREIPTSTDGVEEGVSHKCSVDTDLDSLIDPVLGSQGSHYQSCRSNLVIRSVRAISHKQKILFNTTSHAVYYWMQHISLICWLLSPVWLHFILPFCQKTETSFVWLSFVE